MKRSPALHYSIAVARSFLTLLLLALLLLAAGTQAAAHAQHTFHSETHGLTLSYPATFEAFQSATPEVLLLLRDREKSYPTFNVIVQGSDFDASAYTPEQFAERIVNDYHKVGILQVKPTRTVKTMVAGRESYTTELLYNQQAEPLIAAVTFLTNGDRHYILTYIDKAEDFYPDKRLREDILDSIQLKAGQTLSADLTPLPVEPATGYFPAAPAAVGLIIVVVALGLAWRSRRESSGTP